MSFFKEPNYAKIVRWIWDKCRVDLTGWEESFIRSIHYDIQNHPDIKVLTDDEINAWLSSERKYQIQKISDRLGL